jgi:hypothetical protein
MKMEIVNNAFGLQNVIIRRAAEISEGCGQTQKG